MTAQQASVANISCNRSCPSAGRSRVVTDYCGRRDKSRQRASYQTSVTATATASDAPFPGIILDVPDSLLTDKIREKLERKEYEADEARAVRMRLKPGSRVLELGGGIGYVSSFLAGTTRPDRVSKVEANIEIVEIIRHNLMLNKAPDVTVVHGAVVGDIDEDKVLFRPGKAFWGSSLAKDNDETSSQVEGPALKFSFLLDL